MKEHQSHGWRGGSDVPSIITCLVKGSGKGRQFV